MTTGNPSPTVSESGLLPAGVTFSPATKTLSGTPAAGTVGSYPITFTATNGVPPDATQSFTLVVAASSQQADLSITKSDNKTTVKAGNSGFDYKITVKNSGPNDATKVVVTDTWPSQFVRTSLVPGQGSCSPSTGTGSFTCNLGTVKAGKMLTIDATFSIPASTPAGPVTNTVSISSAVSDPNPANNTASDTNTVVH
jgi:uncharacterized repeat protein (TIGR01451 family)